MATRQTQQFSPTYLLTTSKYPWKLLVVMHHGSMELMKETTKAFIKWLDQVFLTVINMQINGDVQQRHQQNAMDAESTVH